MTATDLHQRMLHQLDRVKALNASTHADAAQPEEPHPHASQHPDVPDAQPHIPAIRDETADIESQETVADHDDKRSEPRPEVNYQGLVVFAGQESGLKCDIMNLTDGGAKLRLANEVTVPSCFELTILPDGTAKTAQVCWRDECELGIQFVARD